MITISQILKDPSPDLFCQFYNEWTDNHAKEFAPQLGSSSEKVLEGLKRGFKEYYTSPEGRKGFQDALANGMLKKNLKNGFVQRLARDGIAQAVLEHELGKDFRLLLERAGLESTLTVSHQLPKKYPVAASVELNQVIFHPNVVNVLSKREKLAWIAHELAEIKLNPTRSTRETEFAADKLSLQWTRDPEALKSALDTIRRWDIGQSIAKANKIYARILPERMAKKFETEVFPAMEAFLNSSRGRELWGKFTALYERFFTKGEHPTDSERVAAIDKVAASWEKGAASAISAAEMEEILVRSQSRKGSWVRAVEEAVLKFELHK